MIDIAPCVGGRASVTTHKRYRVLRVGVIDPTIVSHRGEIVKNIGDGFVAVFESPRDALRSAFVLQHEIANLTRREGGR
jgi:adenylate cyclase